MPQAVQAWAGSVNASGGINCHRVRVVVADDGADSARGYAAVKNMVESEHIIALVGSAMAFTGPTAAPYLEQKRVPVVGGDGTTTLWWESPMFFPQVLYIADQQYLMVAAGAAATKGRKFALFYCVETPACTAVRPAVSASVEAVGGELVYESQISVAQPDFTAQCLQARQRSADILMFVIDAPTVGRFASSCARQDYHPTYANQGVGLQDGMLANPSLEGLWGGQYTVPWFLTSGTAPLQEYGDVMRRFAPGVALTPGTSMAWTASKLFEKAARNIGTVAIPAAAPILDRLWSMHDETLDGLIPPVSFVRGAPAPKGRCGYLVAIRDKRWVAPQGLNLKCSTISVGR